MIGDGLVEVETPCLLASSFSNMAQNHQKIIVFVTVLQLL